MDVESKATIDAAIEEEQKVVDEVVSRAGGEVNGGINALVAELAAWRKLVGQVFNLPKGGG